ncbi:MAG: outer membrane beta-barrel protein [Burkholderiales bacterium]|nr:outer membrane beta-barrel protein [Burkholderiales bacterium]
MKRPLHWSALATLCVASGAYAHPEDTVRLKLEYNVSHDSNYFRVANDAQAQALLGSTDASVTTHRVGAGVDADLRFGRQVVALRSSFSQVDFDRVILKPATELSVKADWNWVVGNRLSGSLNYQTKQDLQSQADVATAEQSKQKQTVTGFSASYQAHPSFYLDFGLSEATYAFSPDTRKVLDRTERGHSFGWRMPTSAGNYLGMQYRKTEGDYPNQLPARPYEQTEYNLNGNWAPTGMSRLAWAVGRTRRVDGLTTLQQPTWSLSGNWAPTGKLSFNASWGKSVGSSDTATVSTTTATDNATLGATWLATSKITLSGTVRSQNVQYDEAGRTDQIRGGGLTLGYQALRSAQATLSYDTERRNSTAGTADYHFERWSAGLQAAF